MVKPAAYRQAVGFVMTEFALSLRRACGALGFPRSSWHYASKREPPVELIEKLRSLASKRPRWGYRMLHLMLKRDGVVANHKRIYRLYKEGGTCGTHEEAEADRAEGQDGAGGGGAAERPVVDGLRLGRDLVGAALSDLRCGGRLHARDAGAGGRHLARRRARGPRARRARRAARRTGDDCLRQRP